MITHDGLPVHLYPDDVDGDSPTAKHVERTLRGMHGSGLGLLDIEELDKLKRSLLMPYVRDPGRYYAARHEPETIAAVREIQAIDAAIDASLATWDAITAAIAAFDAAWAEIRASSSTPLSGNDPVD